FAAIAFGKWEANIANPPALTLQPLRRDERVPPVVTFSCINDALPRIRKELPDRSRYSGTGLIHQGLDLDSTAKGCLFRRPHLRRAYNRRVQLSLRFLFRSLFLPGRLFVVGTAFLLFSARCMVRRLRGLPMPRGF